MTAQHGPTHPWVADPGDPYRYGVYLRPDPATCLAVTTITSQLRAQYGFISAGAFPPHATLVGSQHVPGDEEALVAAVAAALADQAPFTVHNSGLVRQEAGPFFDVHHRADGHTVNTDLVDLARAVHTVVDPMTTAAVNPPPDKFDPQSWHAHLSLASHDLYTRPDLIEEVVAYVDDLPVSWPTSFTGDTVTMYRTRSEDWTGRWWHTLTWSHMHTWRLRPAP